MAAPRVPQAAPPPPGDAAADEPRPAPRNGVGSRAEAIVGPWALRLEAQSLAQGRPWSALDPDRAHLALAAAELPANVAGVLRAAARTWHPGTAPGDLVRIEIEAARLRELAREEPRLASLLVAHENAHAKPAPPRLMGIVNVTPDSFSDGGRYLEPSAAIDHGLALAEAGADLLDVGGESTRPEAAEVSEEEELSRVLPVVEGLARGPVPVSIDTRRASVAERALDLGAVVVNDVSAGRHDARMLPLVAERSPEFVCMHMLGTPRDMQRDPRYQDPVREILRFLRERVAACLKAGIEPRKILLDPGLGFGKRLEHNLALIRSIGNLRSLGLPLLVGPSRKSFLSAISGAPWAAEKVGETAAACTASVLFGAEVLRVHDVGAMVPVVRVARALAVPAP